MSIWVDDDMARWKVQLARREVACLVTANEKSPAAQALLARFGRYTVRASQAPVPYAVYCRE